MSKLVDSTKFCSIAFAIIAGCVTFVYAGIVLLKYIWNLYLVGLPKDAQNFLILIFFCFCIAVGLTLVFGLSTNWKF